MNNRIMSTFRAPAASADGSVSYVPHCTALWRRRVLAAAILTINVTACDAVENRAADGPDTPITAQPASATDSSAAEASAPKADRLIRPDGIAQVVPGMTIGQLRAALPAGVELGEPGPYMVDIDAMPVIDGGDTLYTVLIVAGEPRGDDARINLVATTDTTLRTAEGIGPGSTLAEAAAKYGSPTLTYSTNDESREYATFPGLPHTLRFRVRPASSETATAGVYATRGEYNETGRYDPEATVWMAMVLIP